MIRSGKVCIWKSVKSSPSRFLEALAHLAQKNPPIQWEWYCQIAKIFTCFCLCSLAFATLAHHHYQHQHQPSSPAPACAWWPAGPAWPPGPRPACCSGAQCCCGLFQPADVECINPESCHHQHQHHHLLDNLDMRRIVAVLVLRSVASLLKAGLCHLHNQSSVQLNLQKIHALWFSDFSTIGPDGIMIILIIMNKDELYSKLFFSTLSGGPFALIAAFSLSMKVFCSWGKYYQDPQ